MRQANAHFMNTVVYVEKGALVEYAAIVHAHTIGYVVC